MWSRVWSLWRRLNTFQRYDRRGASYPWNGIGDSLDTLKDRSVERMLRATVYIKKSIDISPKAKAYVVVIANIIDFFQLTMFKTAARHIDAAIIPRISNLHPSIMPGIITSPATMLPQVVPKKRRALPAVWMRAGTSKGLYLHRKDLPQSQQDWSSVITRVMGSYDADPKQLDGIGGATSTTSKVAVVSRSTRPGVDVDYTFVQVTIGAPKLDMTGNCGNIASGVGPFAVDEGLVDVLPGQKQVKVRVFNTNTNSVMIETVQVDEEGHFQEDGDCQLPGLCSVGSRVQMGFSKPAGAMTGRLLPSGRAMNTILMQTSFNSEPIPIQVSLVDAANPFCLVDSSTLPDFFHQEGPSATSSIDFIEKIRREAAVLMGLAKSTTEAALTRGTPKIAVLSKSESTENRPSVDFEVVAYSMGKVHGSLQLTGAVCLGTAACTQGTVAYELRNESSDSRRRQDSPLEMDVVPELETVRLRHPGGDMDVDVRLDDKSQVEEAIVFRTARRLFEGKVYYLG
jgi:2-methylaconitate cis-trans-isomerase PrpF